MRNHMQEVRGLPGPLQYSQGHASSPPETTSAERTRAVLIKCRTRFFMQRPFQYSVPGRRGSRASSLSGQLNGDGLSLGAHEIPAHLG